MPTNKIYQIKGQLFHFECLTDKEKGNAEVNGTEVSFDKVDQEDICATCGEQFEKVEDDPEPSELEKEDD